MEILIKLEVDQDGNLKVDQDGNLKTATKPLKPIPDSVAFIHSYLDEYGLDPYEFRVYAHIVRRTGGKPSGACFASQSKIAQFCKMSKRKVQSVLTRLMELNMITRRKNGDKLTNEYRVTLPSEWKTNG